MERSFLMGYVFISYSTKNAEQAKTLHKVLTDHGIGAWMAPGNIPVGSSYAGEITRALKGADGLVLLLTDAAQNSMWVDREVERALNYGKPVFPVALELVTLNDNFELYIGSQQIVPVQRISEQDEEFRKILEQIRREVKEAQVSKMQEQVVAFYPETDDPAEQYKQGFLYMTGYEGHEKDEEKAFFWLKKAADTGHPWAQYYLAWLFKRGAGTIEDPEKAACLFEKAAEAGIAYAIHAAGDCYRKGYGVKKNPFKAIEWLKKGRDSAACCLALGEMYEFGEGIKENLDEALYYYECADRLGGTGDLPKKNIIRVEKKLGIE